MDQLEVLDATDEIRCVWSPTLNIHTVSWPIDNIILRDVGGDLASVCPFVAGFFFRGLLFVLLGGLLSGGAVVIVLIFTVIALGIIFGSSFQGAAPPRP